MSIKNWRRVLLCMTFLFLFIVHTAQGYETIRPGAEGDAVRVMQSALASLGYGVKPDGKFGLNTELAVKAFQKKEGLTTDGLAGKGTLTILYRKAPGFAPPATESVQQTDVANASPEAVPQAGGSMYVDTRNGGSLNLRNQAAYGQNTIAQIKHGEMVQAISSHGKWTKVSYAGRNGYVLTAYLNSMPPALTDSLQNPENPPQTSVQNQPAGQTMVVSTKNGGSLNLRNTASYGQNIVGKIPHGAQVSLLASTGKWAQISFQGSRGYVLLQYLSNQPVNAPESNIQTPGQPSESVAQASAQVNTKNNRSLNFRNAPASGMNIVGQIPSKTMIEVIEKGEPFSRVIYNGQQGFVMTSYLKFDLAGAPNADSQTGENQGDASAFLRTLRFGDQGQDVSLLQSRLNQLKYPCAVNGVFDQATKDALVSFQNNNGLKADGIMGLQSSAVLMSSTVRAAGAPAQSYATLKIDQTDGPDKAISSLQSALSKLGFALSVNGRFDIATYQAVLGFQEQNGLSVTGIADVATQTALYAPGAKGNQAATSGIGAGEGKGGNPGSGAVKLLHWFNDVKKSASAGQRVTVYHPGSNSTFTLRLYSMGRHADAEPLTLKDTQIMNRGFGAPSWNINIVYVKLPDGRWTLASMHNRPHLSGAISDNGFGGHLCVHFLRDMEEVTKSDPNYGTDNQKAIRKAWKSMTGKDVP